MKTPSEPSIGARMASVLIPVVVGSLLGLVTSIATRYYDIQDQRAEAARKDHAVHLERAMTLCARYLNDVGRLLSIGVLREGAVKADDLAVMSAPTDTLTELSVVVSLYLPQLRGDVEKIYAAHQAMMLRYDEIVGTHSARPDENAAAYEQRIRKALAPTTEGVRNLMRQIGALAQRTAST